MGMKPRRSAWQTYSDMLAPYAAATDARRGDLGPTPLRFVNPRHPTSVDELDAGERARLEAAGTNYDGMRLPAAIRLSTDDLNWEPSLAGVEMWDVLRDGALAYHAFIYRGDSGSFFAAGTTTTVGHIIQTYVDHCEVEGLQAELKAALQIARRDARGRRFMLHNMC